MGKRLKSLVSSPKSLSLNKVCGKGVSLFPYKSHGSRYNFCPRLGVFVLMDMFLSITDQSIRQVRASMTCESNLHVSPDSRGAVGASAVVPL